MMIGSKFSRSCGHGGGVMEGVHVFWVVGGLASHMVGPDFFWYVFWFKFFSVKYIDTDEKFSLLHLVSTKTLPQFKPCWAKLCEVWAHSLARWWNVSVIQAHWCTYSYQRVCRLCANWRAVANNTKAKCQSFLSTLTPPWSHVQALYGTIHWLNIRQWQRARMKKHHKQWSSSSGWVMCFSGKCVYIRWSLCLIISSFRSLRWSPFLPA